MTEKKTKPNIELIHDYGIDIRNRTIYLTSEYTWRDDTTESGTEFSLYSRFVKNMDILNNENDSPITIKSSNIGGDWYYGMAIYDIIKKSKSPTNFYIDAYACSMGSIIPQAATKRYISKWADFLVHLGTCEFSGESKSVASTFKHYETKTPLMYNIYAVRCINGDYFKSINATSDDVVKYLKEMVDKHSEWWMSAEDALKFGFVDEIY